MSSYSCSTSISSFEAALPPPTTPTPPTDAPPLTPTPSRYSSSCSHDLESGLPYFLVFYCLALHPNCLAAPRSRPPAPRATSNLLLASSWLPFRLVYFLACISRFFTTSRPSPLLLMSISPLRRRCRCAIRIHLRFYLLFMWCSLPAISRWPPSPNVRR